MNVAKIPEFGSAAIATPPIGESNAVKRDETPPPQEVPPPARVPGGPRLDRTV